MSGVTCAAGNATSHPLLREFVRQHGGIDVEFVTTYDGGHEFDLAGRFEPRGNQVAADTWPKPPPAVPPLAR